MRPILALCLLLAFAAQSHAATAVITFSNATPNEVRAANWALARVNDERAINNLPPYATVKAYLEDYIINTLLPQWVAGEAAERQAQEDVATLWKNATDAQRQAAIAALQQ